MTEQQARKLVIDKCIEVQKKGKTRAWTVETYNKDKPYARGYKVRMDDALCASLITAIHSALGMTKFTDCIGKECGALQLRRIYEKLGEEISREEAKPGDIVWFPGHVGFYMEKYLKNYDKLFDMQAAGAKPRNYRVDKNFRYFRVNYAKIAAYMTLGDDAVIEPPRVELTAMVLPETLRRAQNLVGAFHFSLGEAIDRAFEVLKGGEND